jgi:hypothetical protein
MHAIKKSFNYKSFWFPEEIQQKTSVYYNSSTIFNHNDYSIDKDKKNDFINEEYDIIYQVKKKKKIIPFEIILQGWMPSW